MTMIDVPYQFINQDDFSGGMNTYARPERVGSSQGHVAENCWSEPFGSLSKRGGTQIYNTVAMSGPLQGLYRFYQEGGSAYFLAVDADNDVLLDAGSGDFTGEAIGSFTNAGDVYFLTWREWCILANGAAEYPRAYNGTIFRELGMPAPETTCTVGEGDGGEITGKYKYKITFVYTWGESKPSPASAPISVTDKKINLTVIPKGDTNCIERNIYRTEKGEDQYFFLHTINDNETTTYTDIEGDDTALGDGTDLIFNNDMPPHCQFLAEYAGRVYFAKGPSDESSVWYSKVNQPNAVPATNLLVVGSGKGDSITGLVPFGDILLVFKRNTIYQVKDYGGGTVEQEPVSSFVGCIAPRSITRVPGGIIFLSHDGIYHFNGAVLKNITEEIVDDEIKNITKAKGTKAVGCVYKRYFLFAYDSSEGTDNYNDRVLALDLDSGGWFKWFGTGWNPGIISIWDGGTDSNELYYAHADTGFVYRGDYGNYDEDSATGVKMRWEKRYLLGGGGINESKVRDIRFDVETSSRGNLSTLWEIDNQAADTEANITISLNVLNWEDGIWDAGVWNSGTVERMRRNVRLKTGRQFDLTIRHSEPADIEIKRFDIRYQDRGRRNR